MSVQSTNINDTFFEGVYRDVWRKLIQPSLSEAECDFVESEAQLQKGDSVLDLMCGYGRHAVELARRGYVVTAVDNAGPYIDEIKATAANEALQVEAFATSALEVELTRKYKAILCMGNSFAFFDRADAVALLKKVASHLEKDGIFIINSWAIAEIAIKYFKEKDWCEVDGYKYMMDNQFKFHPSRIESEHTIVTKEGRVEVLNGIDYVFTLSELEGMFKEASLTIRGLYSTLRKRPFKMGDNKIYIVIEKDAE